jgi:carbon-monoxide dehydrogenase medium subunit
MAARLYKIHNPTSVDELINLLAEGRGRVAPVGGGVSFSFAVPSGITELASLRSLGLDRIELDGEGLRLGAMVTVAQLAESREASRFRNGLLADAASKVAATPNRNLITLGGNACRLFIWSDLPVVYCAAGASFVVRGPEGTRTLSCDELYASQPASVLRHSEFLEEIVVPAPPARSGDAFEKFCETRNQFALVSAAACVTLDDDGKCASARLALGGMQLLPRVSEESARVLKGSSPSAVVIRRAAEAAVAAVRMIKDIRVSEEYKRGLAVTIACRALAGAFERAKGGE